MMKYIVQSSALFFFLQKKKMRTKRGQAFM